MCDDPVQLNRGTELILPLMISRRDDEPVVVANHCDARLEQTRYPSNPMAKSVRRGDPIATARAVSSSAVPNERAADQPPAG